MKNSLLNYLTQKRQTAILFFLLVLGFSVRMILISVIPAGLNQDEASIGYDAFSILTTGCDRNGNSYPIHLVSWGNGQNALYAYLSMPFIYIFGLNTFSVRIVNALFSSLSLIVFYSLFKLILDQKKALVALAILTICPWSIMSARWGLESNIFPTIFLIGVYFLFKGIIISQKYFPTSFLIFAISLYSYGTSYLIVPLFFSLIIPFLFITKRITFKNSVLSLSIFSAVALPLILFIIINHLSYSQFQIFGLTVPKLLSNRTTQIFNIITPNFFSVIIKNIVRFLNILVLQSDGNDYNAIPSVGTIYAISLPFFIIGLLNVLKKSPFLKEPQNYIFVSWLVCSFALGFSSQVNINRLNIMFPPLLYFVILGFYDVSGMLKIEYKRYYKSFLVIVYSLLFFLFTGYYFIFFNDKIKNDFSYGLGDAIKYAEKIDPKGTINITKNTINMPYIYVCFYNQIDPEIFRKTVVYGDNNNGFITVNSFGHYTFGNSKTTTFNVRILSKEEMVYYNLDLLKYKNFGNYFVVQNKN
ncbi:MAG: glycosyltransferase family 39 protein [Paludibacter sp.]|nr:glycosyltransferase family 39 protein [Paludibacter sp.]